LDQEAERVGKKLKKTPIGKKLAEDLTLWRKELTDYF
jgi:hypothetical protein